MILFLISPKLLTMVCAAFAATPTVAKPNPRLSEMVLKALMSVEITLETAQMAGLSLAWLTRLPDDTSDVTCSKLAWIDLSV